MNVSVVAHAMKLKGKFTVHSLHTMVVNMELVLIQTETVLHVVVTRATQTRWLVTTELTVADVGWVIAV